MRGGPSVHQQAHAVWHQIPLIDRTVTTSGGTVTTVTGNVNGSVGSVTGSVGSVTGAVGSVTAPVTVGTNNDKTGYTLTAAQEAAVKQIRTIFTQDVTHNNGGGVVQNFVLGTSLANFAKAYVASVQQFDDVTSGNNNAHPSTHSFRLTSNTNLRISGSDASARVFRVVIIEYQNLPA